MRTNIRKSVCAASVSITLLALAGSAWAETITETVTENPGIQEGNLTVQVTTTGAAAYGVRTTKGGTSDAYNTIDIGGDGATVSIKASASDSSGRAYGVYAGYSFTEVSITADSLYVEAGSGSSSATGLAPTAGMRPSPPAPSKSSQAPSAIRRASTAWDTSRSTRRERSR